MDKVGCLAGQTELILAWMEELFLLIYTSEAEKNILKTKGFLLHVMLEESLGVSVPCIYQLSCGT